MSLAHQWHSKHGPVADMSRESSADRELLFWLFCNVMDVDQLSLQNGSTSHRTTVNRCTLEVLQSARSAEGHHAKARRVFLKDRNILSITKPGGILSDGI
jgi:hypothetical protein